MSWQALNWAAEQKTGSPHAKLLLLLLANRADENGICWPSQLTLAEQAEQSEDTVQRHLKTMEGRFIARARTKRTSGRWPGYVYQLLMDNSALRTEDLREQPARKRVAREAIRRAKIDPLPDPLVAPQTASTTPHPAARTIPLPAVSPGRSQRSHRAAGCGVEPSVEPSGETSQPETSRATAAAPPCPRPRAVQGRGGARLDLIHNHIAQRLGSRGWSILQRLSDQPEQLAQIEDMERRGVLTEAVLEELRNEAMLHRSHQ